MAAAPGVRRSELGEALRACRNAFVGVGVMSCMINLLYLTGSLFMLEVYDRVLPSRSVPTLIGLIILACGLYAAQGVLDLIRGRILGRVGTSLDEALNARVFDIVVRLPLTAHHAPCERVGAGSKPRPFWVSASCSRTGPQRAATLARAVLLAVIRLSRRRG